jgi:hypothetical protein
LPRGSKHDVGSIAKKLAIPIGPVRVVIPMANSGRRTRAGRDHHGEVQRPTAESSDIDRLLPWWSKLVHQMLLLATDACETDGKEDGHDSEDRCVASGSPRVRIRTAVNSRAGSRAR